MITFNTILRAEGVDPKIVILLRHQDTRYRGAPTPYHLWRANDGGFEDYQSIQRRTRFAVGSMLASFVVTPINDTLFVGLYNVDSIGNVPVGKVDPINRNQDFCDFHWFGTSADGRLDDYKGRLVVDWGKGFLSWHQHASRQEKPVIEIRGNFQEPAFPSFMEFIKPLSEIASLPTSWIEVLRHSRGVYLLTCPKTKEQYVGSATGTDGFWGRWQDYVQTGHGGNVGLKSHDPSDYRISILEVAGSTVTSEQIFQIEQLWKAKLQSVEMGLNRN